MQYHVEASYNDGEDREKTFDKRADLASMVDDCISLGATEVVVTQVPEDKRE